MPDISTLITNIYIYIYICERGYPEDIVDEQLQRVKSRD